MRALVSRSALAAIALPATLWAQAGDSLPATMADVRVPTRDGIALSTDIWLPAASAAEPGRRRYPTILLRTPYVKNVALFARYRLARYVRAGYAVVLQDTRGRGKSEGSFDFYFPEGPDGSDTIEWIARQAWSNGRIGMDGGSYLGTVQWMAAREHPPHLRCIVPTAASGQIFQEVPYVGGALMFEFSLEWTAGMYAGADASRIDWRRAGTSRPIAALDTLTGRTLPFFQAILAHPTLDPYWRRIQFDARTFADLDIPALIVTGWFDGDQQGALFYWNGMRASSAARNRQHLIIGPWIHQQTYLGGAKRVGKIDLADSSVIDTQGERIRFFNACLKGTPGSYAAPRARIFLTGDERWRSFDAYPPREASPRSLYLSGGGHANTLDGDGRLRWSPPGDEPPDTYPYDPHDPVLSMDVGEDHRAVERRNDVLVYTSDVLDVALAVVGPVRIELIAASDGTDTDFVAKLLDVFPDGRALHISLNPGVIRARYRNGFDRTSPLEPGKPTRFTIRLADVGHVFLAGHRLRLEVTSSAFPFVNQNQNTGEPVATDTVWRVAHQTIYHSAVRASRLVLPVLGTR